MSVSFFLLRILLLLLIALIVIKNISKLSDMF